MKLFCKICNAQITDELTQAKNKDPESDYTYEQIDEEYDWRKYTYKPGIYRLVMVKNDLMDTYTRPSYKVNPYEILVPVIGYDGCCSYDRADIKCNCGELLGTAKDDCWQDTIAYILKSKTVRCDI